MVTETLKQHDAAKKLQGIRNRVLQAYVRGLMSEEQALRQLGLSNPEELVFMLDKAGLSARTERRKRVTEDSHGSIADGFTHFWQSQSGDE